MRNVIISNVIVLCYTVIILAIFGAALSQLSEQPQVSQFSIDITATIFTKGELVLFVALLVNTAIPILQMFSSFFKWKIVLPHYNSEEVGIDIVIASIAIASISAMCLIAIDGGMIVQVGILLFTGIAMYHIISRLFKHALRSNYTL
jgi:hypothetical protein